MDDQEHARRDDRDAVSPIHEENLDATWDNPMSDDSILQEVPIHCNDKALVFLNHIRNKCQTLSWNNRGELLIGGICIPNSHIAEVLAKAVAGQKALLATPKLSVESPTAPPMQRPKAQDPPQLGGLQEKGFGLCDQWVDDNYSPLRECVARHIPI